MAVKIILASVLALLSFTCFVPDWKETISKALRVRTFWIPWIGLTLAVIWTLMVVPFPFRGYILGAILIKLGITLIILPKKKNVRLFLEDMFFGGKEIFLRKEVVAQSSGLIAIGILTVLHFTSPVIDTFAVLAVAVYFVRHGIKSGKKNTEEIVEKDAKSTEKG